VPRPLRIEYPGAIYHVMNRGDRGEAIFTDDDDRRIFSKTLTETCGRTGWRVHAWCLLGNHFDSLAPARSAFGPPVYVAAAQLAPLIRSSPDSLTATSRLGKPGLGFACVPARLCRSSPVAPFIWSAKHRVEISSRA
jgi:hypothetical protein